MPRFVPRAPFDSTRALVLLAVTHAVALAGCSSVDDGPRPPASAVGVYGLANGCYAIDAAAPGKSTGRLLVATSDGNRFEFRGREIDGAAKLFLKAADLGTYVLRDSDGRFVVAGEDGSFARVATLESDVTRNEDGFVSPAEWDVVAIASEPERFELRNRATRKFLGTQGLVDEASRAARVAFYQTSGCAEFPELGLDATGTVMKTHFDDGTLFGFVDAHEHLFTNLSFGAGGVFHGAPFHRLGVEHALPSCEQFHGVDGRSDIIGYFYGGGAFDTTIAIGAFVSGDVGVFNHHTEGYPEFTDWPNSWGTSTHQTQYYRWLERAYLGGMRLLVQHATSNQVLCELAESIGTQIPRISCNEMVSAERIIDEAYALERYVDAQSGGRGRGWFRVVTTPADARRVISDGKLAVILGIETSNLFDCFVNAREGFPKCDESMVRAKLDYYRSRGVRAIFPVHKFDNGFSAGDGHRGFIEIGNLANSGYYSNFTDVGCPDVPAVFDHGSVIFGGLNEPRSAYDAPPPIDASGFAMNALGVLAPQLTRLNEPPLAGDHCQSAGLQPLGETLVREMMRRGMIIEVDHLPRHSYARAYELLREYDYPAAGTHGSDNRGELYALGGISTMGLNRCTDPLDPDAPANRVRARIASIAAAGGYPAQGFGFDFNGFAGGPRPRFGDQSSCSAPQSNGMTYPFMSFAGDVVFEAPHLGNRDVDFDTEGMIHIGLLPELIQDARNVGVPDADLEPLFRSAEGYLRMWERAEERSAALQDLLP